MAQTGKKTSFEKENQKGDVLCNRVKRSIEGRKKGGAPTLPRKKKKVEVSKCAEVGRWSCVMRKRPGYDLRGKCKIGM